MSETDDNGFVIQFVNPENGERSEPFTATQDELVKQLKKPYTGDELDPYVLIVGRVGNEKQLEFSMTPLFRVSTLLKAHDLEVPKDA